MSLALSSIYAPKVTVGRTSQCLWGIRFKVSGRGEFPVDMLRSDACHPTSLVSAGMVYGRAGEGYRTVELESWQRESFWLPNVERWRSFGWTVVTEAGDE